MDRKSVFQAHFANVTEVSQVNAVMRKLLTNKKIADATHNIQVGMNETFSYNTIPSTVCDKTNHGDNHSRVRY